MSAFLYRYSAKHFIVIFIASCNQLRNKAVKPRFIRSVYIVTHKRPLTFKLHSRDCSVRCGECLTRTERQTCRSWYYRCRVDERGQESGDIITIKEIISKNCILTWYLRFIVVNFLKHIVTRIKTSKQLIFDRARIFYTHHRFPKKMKKKKKKQKLNFHTQ